MMLLKVLVRQLLICFNRNPSRIQQGEFALYYFSHSNSTQTFQITSGTLSNGTPLIFYHFISEFMTNTRRFPNQNCPEDET